ncbi:MAG: hypothetical protein R8G33_00815 [Gammaproteobacteria bacterium]|nr:hypothetical protein [Gammaproteobacteria bacterium]
MLGIHNALIAEPIRVKGVAYKKQRCKSYISCQLAMHLILTVFLSFVTLLLTYFYNFDSTLILSYLFFVVFVLANQFTRSVYIALFDIKRLFYIDLTTNIIRVFIVVVVMHYSNASLNLAFVVSTISWILAVAYLFIDLNKFYFSLEYKVKESCLSITIKSWDMGKWLLLEALAYSFSIQIYVIALGYFRAAEEVAVFGVVQNLLNVTNVFIAGVGFYAMSAVRQTLNDSGVSKWFSQLKLYSLSTLIIISGLLVFVSIFGKEILLLLYGDAYSNHAYLIPLFSIAYLLACTNNFYRIFYISSDNPRIPFYARFLSLVVSLCAIYFLINNLGVIGACIGLIVTQVSWLLVYRLNHKAWFKKLNNEIYV